MACTVTQKDIRNTIGESIRSRFSNAIRTSYTDRLSMFIPYDASNPNKDVLFGKVKALETRVNQEYHSEEYGPVISFSQKPAGVEVNVHPSNKLAQAMTKQNELDEATDELPMEEPIVDNDFVYNGEIYASQEDMDAATRFDFEDFSFMAAGYNPTNYNHFIEHKKILLKKVENKIENFKGQRRTDKSSTLRLKIADLNKLKEKIQEEIYTLSNDPAIFDKTMAVFNDDIALIDKLLAGTMPTIENINLAEEMVAYFDIISDTTNSNNNFVDTSDVSLIEPEIKDKLKELAFQVKTWKSTINKAKQQYLLQFISESSALKAMFPNQQLEEIKDIMLSSKSDISLVSQLFATVDKEFTGQETILAQIIRQELERSRSKNKTHAADMIQQINDVQGRVKAKLLSLGYSAGNRAIGKGTFNLITEANYDLFYQRTGSGNKTGRIVHKFADKWFKEVADFMRGNNEALNEAWQEKDFAKVNTALVSKYTWLNDKADFIDITKLPEIINAPEFTMFQSDFNAAESQQYKQSLINQIGEYSYNQIVAEQHQHLEDYLNFVQQERDHLLSLHNVATLAELPESAIHQYNIMVKRNDPFEFLLSHKNGQQGRVDYVIGQTGNQYQSHMRYNSYVPKTELQRVDSASGSVSQVASGYYDPNFKTIEQDEDLLKFWGILMDSASFINTTLNDAQTSLAHNSLLRMSQSMTDILINKKTGALSKMSALMSETGETLKALFSTSNQTQRASDATDVNKGGIETIQAEVNQRFEIFKMMLNMAENLQVGSKTKIKLGNLSQKGMELVEKVTGRNLVDLITEHGNEVFIQRLAKEYLTDQVMEEQTFNLPVMMKAYLDVVSEYKAQKDALPKINLFKDLYNSIQLSKEKTRSGLADTRDIARDIADQRASLEPHNKRLKGQTRLEHWINKNVKGLEDKEYWFKMGRNLNKDQKEYIAEAKKYVKYLEEKIANSTNDDEILALSAEKEDVQWKIDNVGLVYTGAAAYNTVVNRMSILVGLGWNISSQVFNRFQGWYQGMINDTGRYWTQGNFYTANAFINRKAARRFVPEYANEIRKTRLFIEKMSILQDNTNELDRARKGTGLSGVTSKISPYYMMEYVEWHNQVPQILSVLMDHTITDVNGNTVQIFDGHSFPAYNIENGTLVLKPQFRTEENVATWEDFSNNESGDNKAKISSIISMLNGDYSKTGSTFIKSRVAGKSVMTFKTWLPNQIFLRFASNQTDLSLGLRDFDGAYAGAFKDNKSLVAGSAAITATAAIAGVSTLGLGFGLIIPAALIGYSIKQYRRNNKREDKENLETMKQLSSMGRAIVKKAIGLPVNTLSGKDIIKSHQFNELNLTTQDKQNLMFITNELVGLMWMMLFKMMIKGMLGDDEEEEPKTNNRKSKNPYYGKEQQSDAEKERYNLFENAITRLISDATLYINPEGLKDTMLHPAGIDSWFVKVKDLSDGIKRELTGEGDLKTGPNAGKNKLSIATKKIMLPGIFSEWTDGTFGKFGFKKMMDQEWRKDEYMDKWDLFQSDYKEDRQDYLRERKEEKERLSQYWKEEFNYSEDESQYIKDIKMKRIKERVNKQLKFTHPPVNRNRYDADQNRIE